MLHRMIPVVVVIVTSLVVATLLALLLPTQQPKCTEWWTGYWLSNGMVPYSTPYAEARIAAADGSNYYVSCGGYESIGHSAQAS